MGKWHRGNGGRRRWKQKKTNFIEINVNGQQA